LGRIRVPAGIVLSIVDGCRSGSMNARWPIANASIDDRDHRDAARGDQLLGLPEAVTPSFVVRFFPLIQPHSPGLNDPQTTVRPRQRNGAPWGPGLRRESISQRSEGGENQFCCRTAGNARMKSR
jgi:hypothetical protein